MSDTPGADGSASADSTRRDIEVTRDRMGDTLEELGARLNPERLKQQAKDKIRGATIGRVQTMAQNTGNKAANAGRSVTNIVRDNPIPVGLIAAGISWLVWNRKRSTQPQASPERESDISYRGTTDSQPGYATRYNSASYGDAEYSGDGRTSSSYGSEQKSDGGITDKVREKGSDVASKVGDAASAARAQTDKVANAARAQTDKVADAFQANPLPLGVIAAAIGVAAGLAIPSTQKEGELVGEKRDELVGKAKELVTEKKDQVKRVAEKVVSEARTTATEAAREEGLAG